MGLDSLVSSQIYEIIKTIYSTPDSSTSPEARISVLQNTLGQLRLANIATLDALTTHFTRLIELTSADEDYVVALANNLAPCILRPRTESSLTTHEKHAYRLIRDLFAHKESIFGELKRASALSHTPSGGKLPDPARSRAISTDESNRRANMEARARAIASRSRNSSPAPPNTNGRGHRRDRSVDPPTTRFPIQTSPTSTNDHRRNLKHTSLEVPTDSGSPPVATNTNPAQHNSTSSALQQSISESDGISSDYALPPATTHPLLVASTPEDSGLANGSATTSASTNPTSNTSAHTSFAEKRDSRGSTGSNTRFPPRKMGGHSSLSGIGNRMSSGTTASLSSNQRDSVGSDIGAGDSGRGVQLTDRPMDD